MVFKNKTDAGVQSKLSFYRKTQKKIAKLNLSYQNNCETRFFITRPEKRCDEAENHSQVFSEK